ncbi:uncharacterized protein LOC111054142 isoform X3 [Nilaparvata lugens]|uniref:uncharacterized protein LOC111054142 isoform X3 n=1 Tax=Nilaparvata lugens TaxID=108931 RepID=UPI000B98685A|nr:uncharacterized protein LOC111054142 isoform X3 [Nilaparvata lugens]XP_039297479.1 uncharacterized protein LOC111054142 isoform X3 [Nilaparvata lugens]
MWPGYCRNREMNQPRFEVLSLSFNVDSDWFNMVSPTPSEHVDWTEFAKGIGIVCHISSSACDASYSGQLVKVSGVLLLIGFGSWLCCKLLKLYTVGALGDDNDSTNQPGHSSFNSFLKTCYFGPTNVNEDESNSVSSQKSRTHIKFNEKHDNFKRHTRYERAARNGNIFKAPHQASLFQRLKFLVSPDSFNGKSTTDSSSKSSPMCSAQLSSFSSPIFCKPSLSMDSLGLFGNARENSIDSISELSYEVESTSAAVARLDLLQQEIDQIKYNCLSMDQDFITIKCNRNLPGLSNLIETGEDNPSTPTSEEIQKAKTCFKGLYSLTTINRSLSLDLTDNAMSECSVKVSSIEEEALPSLEWDELDDPTSCASQSSDKVSSGVFSKPCDSMGSSQVFSEACNLDTESETNIQRSVSCESAVAMSEGFSSASVSAISSPDSEIVIENIGPKLDIIGYASNEWKGQTQKAETILKGYYEASRNLGFNYIRRIRGDNYCAVRAATFQVLSQGLTVPSGQHVYERLTNSSASSYLSDWSFSRLPQYSDNRLQGIRQCLLAFDEIVGKLECCEDESSRSSQLEHLLNSNPQIDLLVMEAVKLFMLDKAITLHSQISSGRDVPLHGILLFSRDTSVTPQGFLENHLSKVGDTGGLEMVEMLLLGDALGVTLRVIRPSVFGTEGFICFYPEEQATPQVTLISEDDRHYNILVN